MEQVYTKSDIMQALSYLRTPCDIEREEEKPSAFSNSDPAKFAFAGAEVMAAALLDNLDANSVRKKLIAETGMIAAKSFLNSLTKKQDQGDGGDHTCL